MNSDADDRRPTMPSLLKMPLRASVRLLGLTVLAAAMIAGTTAQEPARGAPPALPACSALDAPAIPLHTTLRATLPLATGHGTNIGDPSVVFNNNLDLWFAGDLAIGCGGTGIGLWTSPDGINWSAGACAHTGKSDDRSSMWVDNNNAGPFYGRMYIS